MKTAEKQNKLSEFVDREIIYCISSLIYELTRNPDYDELMTVCSKPDPENEGEYIEAYEHWIVSGWLADKLEAKGEMILRDFMGLTIWGRTCTGQAIYLDSVIEEIYDELQQAIYQKI